jgi:hypothetical protein
MRNGGAMRIIGITDIHGEVQAIDSLEDELASCDLLLLAGDITHFGGIEEAQSIVSLFEERVRTIYAVPGNCDYPEVDDYLTRAEINLHQTSCLWAGLRFIGIGGSTPAPIDTPFVYSEDEYSAMTQALASHVKGYQSILVSHQPPLKTRLDRVMKVKHVGSKSVRAFIEQYQPLFCLTGHIHESRGIDTIDKTTLVNPGPFKEGRYCCITLDKNGVEIELKRV